MDCQIALTVLFFLKTDINIYKLLEQNLLFFYVMIRLVRTGANIDENV
jgi:hypothetical protein